MTGTIVQLVLHYDGRGFSGWQRQASARTVQGVLEDALAEICNTPIRATGAGRTDAGVHARGQSVGVTVDAKWTASDLRRAVNAVLPSDVWIANAHKMKEAFHPRFSALSREYRYYIGTDGEADSPFRRPFEWSISRSLNVASLEATAALLIGEHSFRAFAVKGTAPEHDDHICDVYSSFWSTRDGGLVFQIEANRFLHHMVRFLVGTMVDVAAYRRSSESMAAMLVADDNAAVSRPAPAHGLYLEAVRYPQELYADTSTDFDGHAEPPPLGRRV